MFKKISRNNIDMYTPFFSSQGVYRNINKDDPATFLNNVVQDLGNSFTIHSGVGVIEVDQIDEEVTSNELGPGTYRYKPGSTSSPECLIKVSLSEQKTTDTLDILYEFEEEINWFKSNLALYDKLGQRASRSILLYGPPGYGKTLFVKKVVGSLLKDTITIYINGDDIPSPYFIDALNKLPTIKTVIIEEFANVFTGYRELSQILEFLDGSNSINNCITILTTNHPERIPTNVLRHGRVDKFIRVDSLSDSDICRLLGFFGLQSPTDDDIRAVKKLSVVQIKECLLISMRNKISLKEATEVIKKRDNLLKNDFASPNKKGVGLHE